ncbi:hypothetical protein ACWF82_07135 [Nocardia sp. NPDC055053]
MGVRPTFGLFAVLGLAGLPTVGTASPALADRSVRDATVADLYIRDADPSLDAVAGQFAALWNPNLPMSAKEEVSYHGSTVGPALRGILSQVDITADRIMIMGCGRILSDAGSDETIALGSGPRRLESAYLAVTRGSVEYLGDTGAPGEVEQ